MPRTITPELLEKYLLDECTAEEKQLVENWYASLKGEQRYLDHLPDAEQHALQADTFGNIREELDFAPQTQVRTLRWGWWVSAAASVLLALGIFFFYNKQNARPLTVAEQLESKSAPELVRFENREQRMVTHRLPDSSTITLQPSAIITYPKNFEKDSRMVTFSGEAFFNIQRDKTRPFLIQSGEMVIRVLGTSFNVKAHQGQKMFQVAVVTGRVEVSTLSKESGSQQVILNPQQEALFELATRRLISKATPPQVRKPVYEPIDIDFEETPMKQVIAQLEKKFDVRIQLSDPGLAKCSVTANFESESLNGILEMLCTTLEASYVLSENQITIQGEPCE